jgi:Zn-dependent M28 family amino/carboxypeptidase
VGFRRQVMGTVAVLWAGIGVLVALMVQPFVAPVASAPPLADAVRLQAHVKHLSVDLYPRSFDQFDKLDAAAQYIIAELKASGADVSVQEVPVQEMRYKNIIARFGPRTGAVMVIGAHYDSYGNAAAAAVSPASHTPGADDNASGVAGLLELARLLGKHKPARAIELVAYTLEEPPHYRSADMGSVWHAGALKAAGRDVSLMLSLEMIGYFSDAPDSQSYPLPAMRHLYSERGNFIALVGKFSRFQASRKVKALMAGATDLPVLSMNAPRVVPGVDFSDHRSYWAEGYPAMMVTDTAFMRNAQYHKGGDTWDKLDYPRMAKVVQAVYAVTAAY